MTLENFTINVTGLNVQPGTPLPPNVVTTRQLMDFCDTQDMEIYSAAIRGLITMLIWFVWMGRIRPKWLEHKKLKNWVVFVDKAVMVFIAMQFVIIIVNFLRAG